MTKQFRKLVAQARRCDVPERLQLFGDMPECKATTAIAEDWLFVIEDAKLGVLEGLRMTAPELEQARKRKLRRNLAILVAAGIEMEKQLGNL